MSIHTTTTTPHVWVTAECEHCGRIQLPPTAFTITASGETYTYTCPTCETTTTRPATPDVLTILARAARRAHHHATTATPRGTRGKPRP